MPPPGSWFYKLRRKRGDGGEPPGRDRAPATVTTTPPSAASSRGVPLPPPCTPNRASYYVPSGERGAVGGIPPKRRDTQFPRSPRENDIVFDVVTVSRAAADRFDGLRAMPELKLRPILTKPVGKKADAEEEASGSGSASPTARARRRRRPRVHVKPSGGRKGRSPADAQPTAKTTTNVAQRRRARRRRWLHESLLVVKESADPEEDFLASMAEMIAANDDVRASPRGLEELLACYLALNAAEHHRAIVAAFRRAWLDDAPTRTAFKHRPPPSQGLAREAKPVTHQV